MYYSSSILTKETTTISISYYFHGHIYGEVQNLQLTWYWKQLIRTEWPRGAKNVHLSVVNSNETRKKQFTVNRSDNIYYRCCDQTTCTPRNCSVILYFYMRFRSVSTHNSDVIVTQRRNVSRFISNILFIEPFSEICLL